MTGRRLFRPFCESARDAANSAPGVGLGLALSRRLARSMGGDLRLNEDYKGGANFVLTLREP
jgi:C4-dicarboxylate-specific signal transduction histidine kinase